MVLDLLHEISQTLRHNKLRTALTGLAVAWGVFMLIVLLGVARGVTNSFESNMTTDRNNMLQLWGGYTSKPYGGYREGREITLQDVDMARVAESGSRHVGSVSAVIYGGSQLMSYNDKSVTAEYDGMYPSARKTEQHEIVAGRYINDRDMQQCAHVIVLSDEYARQLFPPDGMSAIGKRISFKGLSWLVIGVYHADWYRDNIIPYTTARQISEDSREVGSVKVVLQNVVTEQDGENAEEEIRNTVAQTHNFASDDESALWINNRFLGGLKARSGISILNVSVWVLGLFSLLSGIVGISNIMFVSVKERTHEIGVRRAIGARPRSILVQIITEAIAITTIFGYIGIVLGTAVTQLIGMATADTGFIQNPTVNLPLAFEVTLVLIVAGALAGLFPALKALKIKPVEALRDE